MAMLREGVGVYLAAGLFLAINVYGYVPPAGPYGLSAAADVGAYKEGELLVRFAVPASVTAGVAGLGTSVTGALGAGASVGKEMKIVPGLCVVKLPAGVNVKDAAERLNKTPGIIYAQPNYKVHALATFPNDPKFAQLWGMNNTGQTGGTADADIDAPEAWDIATGGRDIVVGVIDTGIDYTHPDLKDNIWTNTAEIPGNGIDDDKNGFIDDIHGWDFVNNDGDPQDDFFHGTHCAGTIGAVGNNGIGVAGVNWSVRLMGLKFLDANGGGYTSDAIDAIHYSILMGAGLTSNSWGGGGYELVMRDAIYASNAAGQLFVAAAGNSASNNDVYPSYPASYDSANIISVAAIDSKDVRAEFSCYGPTSVDLGAPGVDILSTFPVTQTPAMAANGLSASYGTISGTSMATPHVAGACALVWSLVPDISNMQVKDIILRSAVPIPALSGKCVTGGRLNIYNVITEAARYNAKGRLYLDKAAYKCQDRMAIRLLDGHLTGRPTQTVAAAVGGDAETVVMSAGSPSSLFNGSITIGPGAVVKGDGALQAAAGQTITITYMDANDGTGRPATVAVTAAVDFASPVISNVAAAIAECGPTITFKTSEPAKGTVEADLGGCGVPEFSIVAGESKFLTDHSIAISDGFEYGKTYYFRVRAADYAGNEQTAQCYTFRIDLPFAGGKGTQDDPLRIYTADDIVLISRLPCIWNKSFRLMADISLKGKTITNIAGDGSTPFDGFFDGGNHTISDFSYSGTPAVSCAGLFGDIGPAGVVKDLKAVNINVYSPGSLPGESYYSAGCVSGICRGVMLNVIASGKVTMASRQNRKMDFLGGLTGMLDFPGRLIGCSFTGTVSVSGYFNESLAGGLVGVAMGGMITGCSTNAAVYGSDSFYGVGGLAAYNNALIAYCTSAGSVVSPTNDYGITSLGGLAGMNDSYGIIRRCSSSASVNGADQQGGLVGWNYMGGTIEDSFAEGDILWTPAEFNVFYSGGLVARVYDESVIRRCYAVGSVPDKDLGGSYNNVGGLIGWKSSNSIIVSDCYWDIETTGVATSFGGTWKRTVDMKKKATYKGWDFVNIWKIDEGLDYPKLRGQYSQDGTAWGGLNQLARWWLATCDESNDYCDCQENSGDKTINLSDFARLARHWNPAAEPVVNIVSRWKMDETTGTTAADSSGSGHSGTLAGTGVVWAPGAGKTGGAVNFNASITGSKTGRITVPMTGMSESAGTIAFWTKLTEPQHRADRGGIGYFFGHLKGGTGTSKLYLSMSNSNTKLDVSIGSSAAPVDIAALTTAVWQHIAVTWVEGSYAVYVNGASVKTGATNLAGFNTTASIGNKETNDYALDGLIDDFQMYGRALSAEEVQVIYGL